MVALKARFDGEKIITPEALRGFPAGEVIVVVQETATASQKPSIFDFIGKAAHQRSADDINAQIREERESWGDR